VFQTLSAKNLGQFPSAEAPVTPFLNVVSMFLPLLLFFMQCAVAFASDANVDQYLTTHNNVRKANRVPPLQWSEKLAQAAQDWADTCQFKHSNGTLRDTPYGENMVAATGTFPISTALALFSKDAGMMA
jgi:uncharacterized protein YkwD